MCGSNAHWTAKANHARCIAIATLVFAILSLICFAVSGIVSGAGSVISIVACSLLICCGPAAPGIGAGFKFKFTSVLALLSFILHVTGVVLMITVITDVSGNNAAVDTCLSSACAGTNWHVYSCHLDGTKCASQNECLTSSTSHARTSCESVSEVGGVIVAFWVSIVLWPAIILTCVTLILELSLAINSWQAAASMEDRQPTMTTKPTVAAVMAMDASQAA